MKVALRQELSLCGQRRTVACRPYSTATITNSIQASSSTSNNRPIGMTDAERFSYPPPVPLAYSLALAQALP